MRGSLGLRPTYLAAVDASLLISSTQVVVVYPAIVPATAVTGVQRDEVDFCLLHDICGVCGPCQQKDSVVVVIEVVIIIRLLLLLFDLLTALPIKLRVVCNIYVAFGLRPGVKA